MGGVEARADVVRNSTLRHRNWSRKVRKSDEVTSYILVSGMRLSCVPTLSSPIVELRRPRTEEGTFRRLTLSSLTRGNRELFIIE